MNKIWMNAIRASAANNPWWNPDGTTPGWSGASPPADVCVAAYRGRGAVDYAGSKVNLPNSGQFDLTETNGAIPWDVNNGWDFVAASLQAFDTGVTPGAGWTMIVEFADVPSGQTNTTLAGSDSTDDIFIIPNRSLFPTNGVRYRYGASTNDIVPVLLTGNLCIAGGQAYRNGVAEGTPTGTWGGGGALSIYIGASHIFSGAAAYITAKVRAFALYNSILDADQVLLRAQAMSVLSPTAAITIDSPSSYQVFQRDGSDQADIVISGTYAGSPTAIEASWNGGSYATIDASPAGGAFSGSLSAQAVGQGTLSVRFTNQTTVIDTADFVGIGDVFIVAGQSNGEGHATNHQIYSHASLKASMFREGAGAWQELDDPSDSDSVGGSAWPLLATLHMAAEGVPVGFITTAEGSTGLANLAAHWQKGGGGKYENCLLSVANSGITGAVAMLWYQGETDARDSVTQAAYQTALSQMLDDFQSDLWAGLPLICAQIGHDVAGGFPDRSEQDAIRLAQIDRWVNDADIYPGPLTYDMDLSGGDGIHIKTDAHIGALANRWWRTIQAALFGGAEAARGPQFSTATRSGTTVTVTFTGGEGSLQNQTDTTGWRFTDDGTPITINGAAANGTNAVDLTLASTPAGTELISFGSGNDAAGATLSDSGTYPLPPEPFIDEAVV